MQSAHPPPVALLASLSGATQASLPEWEAVAAAVTVKAMKAGSVVFHQDVVHPYVYAVRKGVLKLCYLAEDGTEWVKSFATEGKLFASLAALEPSGRTSFMAATIECCEFERIEFSILSSLSARHLAWSQALGRLVTVFAALKEKRERELLTLSPEQRYRAFRSAEPHLESRISQQDLARHLGVTPVGLNRIVARVRRARL